MKQLHSEIPILKTQIVIIRANQKKINVKASLKRIRSNFFSRTKGNKIDQNFSTMYVVRKLKILIYYVNVCYLKHILSYIQNVSGSGIQNTGKLNKLLSVMTKCRHGFHNGAMEYMLEFG